MGYDSSLYLSDQGPLGNVGSTTTTISAKVSAKFDSGVSLNYTPTFNKFWEQNEEDNVKHVLGAAWKQKVDALSFNAATEFAVVNGSSKGADYGAGNDGIYSAFAPAAPRERRDQLQNKSDLMVRYDTDMGFVRGVSKLQYWDLQTTAPTSTSNTYVDRSDVQGGLDIGRSFAKDAPEYYLGYRNGYQFQDRDAFTTRTSDASNHYDRYLAGVDGKVCSSVKLNAQAGWARHQYNASYVDTDQNVEGLFTDITATWTASTSDELQVKTSQGRTVSTTGLRSILASQHQLAWKHTFNKEWSTNLTARLSEAEYNAAAVRDDLCYTGIAALTWNASAALSCTFSVTQDMGRENHNGTTGITESNREFDRTFASAGVTWSL